MLDERKYAPYVMSAPTGQVLQPHLIAAHGSSRSLYPLQPENPLSNDDQVGTAQIGIKSRPNIRVRNLALGSKLWVLCRLIWELPALLTV